MLSKTNNKNNNDLFLFISRLLEKNYQVLIHVSGLSMLPGLFPGDQIWIQNIPDQDYLKGDILIFKHRGKYIAHRLIARLTKDSKTYYLCRGDSSKKSFDLIPGHSVIAKVIHIKRTNMFYTTFIKNFIISLITKFRSLIV